jgi:hypothetical protein
MGSVARRQRLAHGACCVDGEAHASATHVHQAAPGPPNLGRRAPRSTWLKGRAAPQRPGRRFAVAFPARPAGGGARGAASRGAASRGGAAVDASPPRAHGAPAHPWSSDARHCRAGVPSAARGSMDAGRSWGAERAQQACVRKQRRRGTGKNSRGERGPAPPPTNAALRSVLRPLEGIRAPRKTRQGASAARGMAPLMSRLPAARVAAAPAANRRPPNAQLNVAASSGEFDTTLLGCGVPPRLQRPENAASSPGLGNQR